MAYEKLLNEIYAVVSLKYLWRDYFPFFYKSESPDWINEKLDMGLEVSQALLPEDGQAESVIETYLGCTKEELPAHVVERYGERLHFYNNRFWAILPEEGSEQDYVYKVEYRYRKKLEKLNSHFKRMGCNVLYLYVHPKEEKELDIPTMIDKLKAVQKQFEIGFDCVFLNCKEVIYILHFDTDTIEMIPLPENAAIFLFTESERLRNSCEWKDGDKFDV